MKYALTTEEEENLRGISNRMMWLSKGLADDGQSTGGSGKPRNFLEAVQLLFTLHSCLHLTCEPTAVGRIDIYLEEFLDITEENTPSNQEVIDSFWVKVGERVQLNKQNPRDMKGVGDLAVVYSANGAYAGRGSALNQWVQQCTVGGYDWDETTGKVTLPSALFG